MTANRTESGDGEERTDSELDYYVQEGETLAGDMAGTAFFAPERAAVTVRATGDHYLKVHFRGASNSRGLEFTWMATPEEAREIIDELTEALDELEE